MVPWQHWLHRKQSERPGAENVKQRKQKSQLRLLGRVCLGLYVPWPCGLLGDAGIASACPHVGSPVNSVCLVTAAGNFP